jgi:hypothetical protein
VLYFTEKYNDSIVRICLDFRDEKTIPAMGESNLNIVINKSIFGKQAPKKIELHIFQP